MSVPSVPGPLAEFGPRLNTSWREHHGDGALGPAAELSLAAFRTAIMEALADSARINRQPPRGGVFSEYPPPIDCRGVKPGGQRGETPCEMEKERTLIAREARRTGIQPELLVALRRTENGGAGREFGVRSVAAPSMEEQARVAANSLRNSMARFHRLGGEVIDPATGQYSDAFLRYFSARYAPAGAENDPTGLNRHHAKNLMWHYRRALQTAES